MSWKNLSRPRRLLRIAARAARSSNNLVYRSPRRALSLGVHFTNVVGTVCWTNRKIVDAKILRARPLNHPRFCARRETVLPTCRNSDLQLGYSASAPARPTGRQGLRRLRNRPRPRRPQAIHWSAWSPRADRRPGIAAHVAKMVEE